MIFLLKMVIFKFSMVTWHFHWGRQRTTGLGGLLLWGLLRGSFAGSRAAGAADGGTKAAAAVVPREGVPGASRSRLGKKDGWTFNKFLAHQPGQPKIRLASRRMEGLFMWCYMPPGGTVACNRPKCGVEVSLSLKKWTRPNRSSLSNLGVWEDFWQFGICHVESGTDGSFSGLLVVEASPVGFFIEIDVD